MCVFSKEMDTSKIIETEKTRQVLCLPTLETGTLCLGPGQCREVT